MTRRLRDGSEDRVGGWDIHANFVDNFADRGMTLCFAMTAQENYRRKGDEYSGISLLEA